jgi:hypothetical protein
VKASDISEFELLEYIQKRRQNWELPTPDLVWMERGFPLKVVYAKLQKLLDRGLIEYGVSLRTGWLTPAGERRLEELRTKT